MHKARSFFFVCAGLLCLALAYHLGAQSATAQAPGNPVVGFTDNAAVTANGDVYVHDAQFVYHLTSNVFSGPTPATQETWGGVKARYRQGAAATPSDK